MSDYTKSTNFATKDNLTPGDPLKIVRGTEIDTEFNNIATAIATKTDNASAAITGGSITGITDLAIADGGTGASTATAAINNLLPSQTSNANKYLQTDGTNVSWDAVSLSTADITGTLPVANGGTGVTSSTGTGSVVLSNSPTLVTPALGTPASGVATNLTGLPLTTGVTGTLSIANGGTGQTTANAAFNALAPSQATASGKYLKSDGTNTSWDALDISTADITGTLPVANGGTGVTTSTGTGSVVLSNSPTLVTPALGTPSSGTVTNLTGTASININGTVGATTPTTGAFTTVAASGAVTLSGGTANGVTYLNGSKVLTSGSALTFNGSTLGVNFTGTSNYKFYVSRGGTAGELVAFTDGTAQTLTIDTAASSILLNSANGGALAFGVTTEQMRLTSTGLGIGTSSPSAKLHVSGQSRVADSSNAANYILIGSGANAPRGGNSVMAQTGSMVMGTEAASNLVFITNAAEAGRFDSSGNLGIGVTPSAGVKLQIANGELAGWAGTSGYLVSNTYYGSGDFRYVGTGAAARYQQISGAHAWLTAASGTAGNAISFTQAMTLDASGNLLLGTTSQIGSNKFNIVNSDGWGAVSKTTYAGWYPFQAWNSDTSLDNYFVSFGTEATFTQRGSITYNRTAGLVAYNTTSDYRAKDITGPVTNSGALIDSTPVYMGKMKGATQERPMFIAHETPEYAHTGEKDAVDADGNPVYQQIDASALIPVMWAEIQSLRQRLAAANL